MDYTGIKCPVCGVPFRSGDDIVVCPECGAPYHRACYQEKGQCIFEELHKAGKAWEPPAPPKAPDPSAEIKDRECPVCGTLNAHSALFCSVCGASLTGEPRQYNNTNPGRGQGAAPYGQAYQNQGTPPPFTGYGGTVPPFSFDPMGGVSPAEVLDTGVTFGDASKLVKQNTAYYMPVFRHIKHTGKNKFNFTAFLFSGPWMLFRKQYKYGTLVTVLMFALYTAFQCSLYLGAYPVLLDLMGQIGMDSTQMMYPTNAQYMAMAQLASPTQMLLMCLPLLLAGAMLIVMVIVGFRANKMYMRHCIRTAQAVKAAGNDGDPNNTLDAKGGVNAPLAICLGVCYLIILNLPLWLL